MKTKMPKPKMQESPPAGPNGELGEGLYELMNGPDSAFVYIQNGFLHVPVDWMGRLEAVVCCTEFVLVGKQTFVRASEVIACHPDLKEHIEILAKRTHTRLHPSPDHALPAS